MDKEYQEGVEDARDVLKSMDAFLKAVYEDGKAWLRSHPWQTAYNEDMRAIAINMTYLTNRADQSGGYISSAILKINRVLKEAERDGKE